MGRIEDLRDMIVSKGDRLVKRVRKDPALRQEMENTSVEELRDERNRLKLVRDGDQSEALAERQASRVASKQLALKTAAVSLVESHKGEDGYQELCQKRDEARLALNQARSRYEELSRAKKFLDAGRALDARLAAASDEEREAWELSRGA
jgi:hypothetical protein